jgi:hypothetical protein
MLFSIDGFKPICDFDWSWPSRSDWATIEELMSLQFVKGAANVVLIGRNGSRPADLGTEARSSGTRARAHGAVHETAGQILRELAALDSGSAPRRPVRTGWPLIRSCQYGGHQSPVRGMVRGVFRTPLASSRWSTGWYTAQKSSPSRYSRTA